jgi:hypothetical protein
LEGAGTPALAAKFSALAAAVLCSGAQQLLQTAAPRLPESCALPRPLAASSLFLADVLFECWGGEA